MPLSPGTRLGVFEIVSPLGTGGMGEVYRAKDSKLGRDVAIKVLPDAFAEDAERLARFEREAKVLASLNHPNIASIYGHEQSENTHYLVLELVEGETLAERIARGPIPYDEALEIAERIADALEEAHEKGIVHRDLKPANVKLTPDDGVKVLDFGLAKALAEDAPDADTDASMSPTLTRDQTRAGVILGTAAYMSPEQAKGKRVDKRTDIFAFGALLYELLTGKKAFPGEDVSEILAAIIKLEPDWDALPESVTPRTHGLLRRCLAKDRKARWRDIGDVKLEIEELRAPSEVPTNAPRRAHPGLLAAALLASAALGAAVMATFTSDDAADVMYADIGPPSEASFPLNPGGLGPPVLSPDSSMVAFAAREADGSTRLWVRSLEEAEAHVVPRTEGAMFPFWSPDSRAIGFFARRKLYKVNATGGPAEELCDVGQFPKGGTWNEAGDIVFAPDVSSPLMLVSEEGGEPTPVTELDREQSNSHRYPQFLPNGRDFLFLARSDKEGELHAVMTGSLDGVAPKLVVRSPGEAWYASGYLLFLRERALVAQPFDPERLSLSGEAVPVAENVLLMATGTAYAVFSASENGRLLYAMGSGKKRLDWVDRTGRTLETLDDVEDYFQLELTTDGTRAAVNIFDEEANTSDLWVLDLTRGVRTRLTFDPGFEGNPTWSPSGDELVFNTAPQGEFDMFRTRIDQPGQKKLLLDGDGHVFPASWSPDGKLVAFTNKGDIWFLPVSPEGEPYAIFETSYDEASPRLSPDQRWVAYSSNESGQREVYVSSFPEVGRRVLVSTKGGNGPWWREDGRELIYRQPGGQIVAVAVDGRGEDFVVSEAVALFQDEGDYAPTADAQRFLVIRTVDDNRRPLTLIQNWTKLLER